MNKFLLLTALTACSLSATALDAASLTPKPFQWMPRHGSDRQTEWHFTRSNPSADMKKIVTSGDVKMESQNGFSYLDMPDGTTWLVELNYERAVNREFDGGYVEYKYTGLKGSIYNDKYVKVAEIDTPIDVPEGMDFCADIFLSSLVTKKFFNIDENYEIMFVAYYRPKDDFGAVPYTYVLSFKNDNKAATHVTTMPGYYISAINTATDKWSENYSMVFFGDQEATGESDYSVTFDIYTKATYSTKKPQKSGSFSVDMTLAPEITGYESQPVLLTANGKDLYVSVAKYEKPYYADASDPISSTMTPGNSYVVELYKKGEYDTTFKLESTTKIACEDVPEGYVYRSYGLGSFNLENDIRFDIAADGSVAYIIGVSDIDNQFETTTSYIIVDKDGNTIKSFGENCESYGMLSSIPGHPEQYVFVENDDDVLGGLVYRFVEFPSFETKVMIPCTFIDQSVNTGAALLSMSMDRTPVGSGYNYVFSASSGFMDGDNSCHEIIWLDAEGNHVRTDVINGGERCNLINPYIRGEAMNPYLFNTDARREYLFLVQRRDSEASTQAHTELCVSNSDGEMLLQYAFDNNAGEILGALINAKTNPSLWVQYADYNDYSYKTEFISLPLNKLNGSGTVEDPYLIESAGDFSLIKNNLAAHYRVANDIDFSGNSIASVEGVFSGTLDGAGHVVKNFVVKDSPIFKNLHSANTTALCELKNLTLSHVSVDGAPAIIAEGGSSANLRINNVHIYKATVNDNSSAGFASIIGMTGVNSEVSECSADIEFNRPEAEYFGGIVGELGSGGKVTACHVAGSVVAGKNVGGIAYNTNSANTSIADCHVNLDIDAANTIGGIVAEAERGKVERNIVEGSIKASTPGSSLYKYKRVEAMKVGGVIGSLRQSPSSYDNDGNLLPEVVGAPIVLNNVVALSEISIPEGSENLVSTTHRIVGHSRINENPAYLGEEENPDYDPNDPDSEAWIINWGDPAPAEACLDNNYAVATLAATDSTVGDGHNLTEGATIAADKLDRAFFEGLGFKFEGKSATEPWVAEGTVLPQLYFEQTAGASMMFIPAAVSIRKGEKTTVTLALDKVEADGISFEQSSESGFAFDIANVTPEGNAIIEIEMLEEGVHTLTARYNALESKLIITGLSGISDILAPDTNAICYDGVNVSAEGCYIALYNIAGMKIGTAEGVLPVAGLANGIYVAVATDRYGKTSSIKIAVK